MSLLSRPKMRSQQNVEMVCSASQEQVFSLLDQSGKSKKNKTSVSKLKQQKLKIPPLESSSSATCTDSSDSDTAASSAKKNTKSLQNDANEEAIALMVSDPPPERYWELLAEERRLALQEALEENERLHKELEELKERNKTLEEVAGQAEYFASLYQMVMEGEVRETESSEASDEESLVAASLQPVQKEKES